MDALTQNEFDEVIHSVDGNVNWEQESRLRGERIRKIVVGSFEGEDDAIPVPGDRLPAEIRNNFAKLFPNLTHLYLWRIQGLEELPTLPVGLVCLDVRGCPALRRLVGRGARLPPALEQLVVLDTPLVRFRDAGLRHLSCLREVAISSGELTDDDLAELLGAAQKLELLDLSGCSALSEVGSAVAGSVERTWPDSLQDVRFDGCTALTSVPIAWPRRIRRASFRAAENLSSLPGLDPAPLELDYLDVGNAKNLKSLPLLKRGKHDVPCLWRKLRTVIIHGSGLEIPRVLFGDSPDTNVAEDVHAWLMEIYDGYRVDNEVKVMLVGDGRYGGKTSLFKQLKDPPETFDSGEKSTHAIRFHRRILGLGGGQSAALNLWDFAGQDIYHSTHRIFFQSQAVFLLCHSRWLGYDGASDLNEAKKLVIADLPRSLSYWVDQIRSLNVESGAPAVLRVMSKADRDQSAPLPAEWNECEGREPVRVSARDGSGLNKLLADLKVAVRDVLGSELQRAIGGGVQEVKARLAEEKRRIEAAAGAYEADPEGKTFPEPYISRATFEEIVRAHCMPTGLYFKRPELLLNYLHRTGFLYYNEQYLKDVVILDQRWIIGGVYAIFRNPSVRSHLRDSANSGRFSIADLERWSVEAVELGYLHEPLARNRAELVLRFMLGSDVCFSLGRWGYSWANEYLMPSLLPDWKDARDAVEQAVPDNLPVLTWRLGDPEQVVSRDAFVRVMAALGSGREVGAQFWSNGFQLEDLSVAAARAVELSFVRITWNAKSARPYYGELTLECRGEAGKFLHGILKQLREVPGFARIAIPTVDAPIEERIDAIPVSEQERGQLTIGLSFAGGPSDSAGSRGSVSRWPVMFARALRKHRLDVRDYLQERERAHADRFALRLEYMQSLVSRDIVVFFISEEFLASPWCMSEFLLSLARTKGAAKGGTRPNVDFLKKWRLSSGANLDEQSWPERWRQQVVDLAEILHQKLGPGATNVKFAKALEGDPLRPWIECIDAGDALVVWRALSEGLPPKAKPVEPEHGDFMREVELIRQLALGGTDLNATRLELAAQLWQLDTDEARRRCFLHLLAVAGAKPDRGAGQASADHVRLVEALNLEHDPRLTEPKNRLLREIRADPSQFDSPGAAE